jgi:urease accessory protein
VLARQQRRGPLTVQRAFHPEGEVGHLYLLHPPGGVVGGDRLELSVDLEVGAHALLTAPGATKVYRSAGAEAEQVQRLRVGEGAVLEWLPQEAILFQGARLRARTRIELDPGARFIGWDITCLGRPVIGERFAAGTADFGLEVWHAGRPLLFDRLRIQGPDALDDPSGLRGYPVLATLVATGAGAEDLAAARAALPDPVPMLIGLTRVDDLLLGRCLAHAVEPVHRTLRALWGILRPRLLGRPACPPRIWAT